MDNPKSKSVELLIKRGHIQEIVADSDIGELLSGSPLRIKWGTDPTSKNIHLGRAVPLMLLRDLQKLGHKIVIVIGNFTAEIGDTSDKESERPVLSAETVFANMQTYVQQIGKIVDLEKAEVHFNRDWWSKMEFSQFASLTNLFSLAEFSARSNIAKRLEAGMRVSMKEMLYPIMQGYDSLHLNTDIEVGGTDQKFNMLAGRSIQRAFGKKPQVLLMTTLIDGLDGRKMSSSWGNTINLTDNPEDMFGKLMSMRDELIVTYLIHSTRVPRETINELVEKLAAGTVNPRDVKFNLATAIVADLCGANVGEDAGKAFNQIFQQRQLPKNIPVFAVHSSNIVDILIEIGFADSRGSARRLVEQGGIRIDGNKVADCTVEIPATCIVRKGKLHFAQVTKE